MSVYTVTKNNFNEVIAHSDRPVLVDFWASWCGPCRMLSPVVDELAEELSGKVKIGKINIDEQMELAQRFQVMTIPTLMVFKNGRPVATSVGMKPKETIKKMLEEQV